MQIHCRFCSAKIPAKNVNIERLVAKCDECEAVFSLNVDDKKTAPSSSEPVPIPENLAIENTTSGITITKKWSSRILFFVIIFTLLWNIMTVPSVMPDLFSGNLKDQLIALLFLGAGLFLIYFSLALAFNRTTIAVSHDELTVVIAPIPWIGNKRFERNKIKQLYCKHRFTQHQMQSRSHNQFHRRANYTTTDIYAVYVVLEDGTSQQMLGALNDGAEALYIEQAIETYLGIKPQAVPGAYTG